MVWGTTMSNRRDKVDQLIVQKLDHSHIKVLDRHSTSKAIQNLYPGQIELCNHHSPHIFNYIDSQLLLRLAFSTKKDGNLVDPENSIFYDVDFNILKEKVLFSNECKGLIPNAHKRQKVFIQVWQNPCVVTTKM